MRWQPTTDDEFTKTKIADSVLEPMREFAAGQSEVSGFAKDDGPKMFSVALAEGPTGEIVAIDVDWIEQTIITAWLVEERP